MDPGTKRCARCGESKPLGDFYLNRGRPDGLSGLCVQCQKSAGTLRMVALREKVRSALGGACVTCGFAGDVRAFQIDHVAGDGSVDRVALGRGSTKFLKAVLADVEDGTGRYQLLCASCNQIKRMEQKEHRPAATYTRVVPTARKEGYRPKAEGLSAEHRQRVSEGLQRLAVEHPEVWADRNRRVAEGNRKPKPKPNSPTPEMIKRVWASRSAGATQQGIADELGVSQGLISKILRGHPGPGLVLACEDCGSRDVEVSFQRA